MRSVNACACAERTPAVDASARARVRSYKRRGQTDRDKEHFRTRARERGERPRSAYLLPLAKERRRRVPAGESHLSAHASSYPFPPFCLLLAWSRSPSRESHRVLPLRLAVLSLSLSLSRSSCLSPPCLALGGLLPIPGVPHYLSFFLHFLCPPLVQMARTISRLVSCPTVSCTSDEYSFRYRRTKEKLSNTVHAVVSLKKPLD